MALNPMYLLIMCFVGGKCYSKFDKFSKLPALADRICPADQVSFETITRSAASCVQKCSETPGCISLIYHHDNKTCYGIKSKVPFSGTSTPLHGAVFYTLINRVVEFCGMKLWFATQSVRYDDARSACSAIGSLAKLDTAAKMEAVKAYLLDANNVSLSQDDSSSHCFIKETKNDPQHGQFPIGNSLPFQCTVKGYNKINFWVQGHYDATDDVWKYDDGTPLLQGYWHPSAPDSIGAYCVMLWSNVRFAFDDNWCNRSEGFICEYQN